MQRYEFKGKLRMGAEYNVYFCEEPDDQFRS